ncbi:hypothetical protein PO883_29935 [Massilia sp. DJPM01]|uniref:hypothetical protein n=1 Tax=Massilia sp. DJPM01 TaxID=3024404 RepID=UPI00259E7EE8|nr:hypothetical protein [Massilia sp. DJPM01]MDM5181405.1 hypothetical protein [Massilia sp. DJPM01]
MHRKIVKVIPFQAIRVLAAQMVNAAQSVVQINVLATPSQQRIATNQLHELITERLQA